MTLYEKKGSVGGLLEFANNVKGPHENLSVLRSYFQRQMEVLGVNVMLNTEATADIIAEASPDIVIAATGGVRDTLGLSDTAGTKVVGIDDFMMADIAEEVVIVGIERAGHRRRHAPARPGKAPMQVVTPNAASAIGSRSLVLGENLHPTQHEGLGRTLLARGPYCDRRERRLRLNCENGHGHRAGNCLRHRSRSPGAACQNDNLSTGLSCEVVTVGDAARPFNIGEAICSGNAAARAI